MSEIPESIRAKLVAMATSDRFDLLEAMLLLCRAIDPEVDTEDARDEIEEIANTIRPWADAEDGEHARVEALVVGMRELGFRGNSEQYYDPRNSMLSEVLVRRTGIPISLSVLFIEVGKRLGIDLRGVGFPFHFLVKAVDVAGLYVDPFFAMTRDESSCVELLAELSGETVPFRSEHLQTVTEKQIFIRVLRNLKSIHIESGAMSAGLDYCELILTIDPEQPAEYRDRGTICLTLGVWNRAVDDLSTYLAMTPQAPDRSTILGQLQWVLHQQNSVH